MRTEWIAKRSGQENVSQMHYARKGVVADDYPCKYQSPELGANGDRDQFSM
jgi:phosphomethylpyrimidine synthase